MKTLLGALVAVIVVIGLQNALALPHSGLGCIPGVNESSAKQDQSDKSQNYGGKCWPEHQEGPKGHSLLSGQIAFFSILFLFGIGFIFQSFNGAIGALDLALDGIKYQWGVVGLWLLLGLVGAGLASGVVTYGLSKHHEAQTRAKDCGYASSNRSVVQPIAEMAHSSYQSLGGLQQWRKLHEPS